MASMRSASLHRPSERAEQAFRRLKLFNNIILGLMITMALLGVWNVIQLASMIRGGAIDLAEVGSILTHISSRLIFLLAAVTLALYIFKEWKWGELSFAMVFVLGPLLFLTLVPVMSAEMEPTEREIRLEVTHTLCAPGGIEGSTVLDSSQCEIAQMQEGDVYMSASDPTEGDTDLLEPNALLPNLASWDVTVRGHFTVYFLLPQESVEACKSTRFVTSVAARDAIGHHCLEMDGVAYSVHPFTTNSDANVWFTIYQEVEP